MPTSGSLALTEGQIVKLMVCISRLEDEALIKLAINSGVRREDIVTVKRADINFNELTFVFYERKKKRFKTIPLSPSMGILLQKHINASNKSIWLFPSVPPRKHICGKTAYNTLQRCLDKAKLPRRPFHALRATCVKLAQRRGWTIEQVMDLTGDTFRTIKLHYDTPSTEEMKEVAKLRPIV